MAKYRILLADSNNQFQTTVRDYLTAQEGIERVDAVSDGQSALDAMNNNRYDVLLCDLIMPGMDGFELLERLNSGLVKDVPAVIVISALRQEEMVRQACTLGAKYYMVKPIAVQAHNGHDGEHLRTALAGLRHKPQTPDSGRENRLGIPHDRHTRPHKGLPLPAGGGAHGIL